MVRPLKKSTGEKENPPQAHSSHGNKKCENTSAGAPGNKTLPSIFGIVSFINLHMSERESTNERFFQRGRTMQEAAVPKPATLI